MTTQITTLNRATVKLVQDRVIQTLAALGEELGVAFTNAGGSFADIEATIKIKVTPTSDAAKEAKAGVVNNHLALLGLPPVCGKTFTENRNGKPVTYRVTGADLGRPKFPVTAEDVKTGTRFKFTTNSIKRHFATVTA